MSVTGSHGFTWDIPVTMSGEYKVCAYGMAVTAFSQGNSLLGCKSVTPKATPAPAGFLESTVVKTDAPTATITVTGWTLDRGTPAASIPVHFYVTDPKGVTKSSAYTANQSRTDVNRVMGTTGNHGYRVALPVNTPGSYKICAYGIAVSVFPLGNSLLGCRRCVLRPRRAGRVPGVRQGPARRDGISARGQRLGSGPGHDAGEHSRPPLRHVPRRHHEGHGLCGQPVQGRRQLGH